MSVPVPVPMSSFCTFRHCHVHQGLGGRHTSDIESNAQPLKAGSRKFSVGLITLTLLWQRCTILCSSTLLTDTDHREKETPAVLQSVCGSLCFFDSTLAYLNAYPAARGSA